MCLRMARLVGVKVFDAEDGAVELIKYNGKFYNKTDELPKKGDIALIVEEWGDQIEGEYYLVNNEDNDMYELAKSIDAEKDYVFIEGETMDADTEPHRVEIFRKQEEEQKDVEEGDLVVMLENDEQYGFEKGDKFPVKKDVDDDLYLLDNNGDERYILKGIYDYEIIGKSEIELLGKKYVYTDRKAEDGDVVVFLENTSICFCNDEPFGPVEDVSGVPMVKSIKYGYVSVYESVFNRTEDAVLVYEPKIEKKSKGMRGKSVDDFVIGMQVKVNVDKGDPKHGWGNVENNDVGKVTNVLPTHIDVDFEKQKDWSATPTELIILDEEDEEQDCKVGEIVVVLDDTCSRLNEGDIGIISEDELEKDGTVRISVPGNQARGTWRTMRRIRPANTEEKEQFIKNLVEEGAFA